MVGICVRNSCAVSQFGMAAPYGDIQIPFCGNVTYSSAIRVYGYGDTSKHCQVMKCSCKVTLIRRL